MRDKIAVKSVVLIAAFLGSTCIASSAQAQNDGQMQAEAEAQTKAILSRLSYYAYLNALDNHCQALTLEGRTALWKENYKFENSISGTTESKAIIKTLEEKADISVRNAVKDTSCRKTLAKTDTAAAVKYFNDFGDFASITLSYLPTECQIEQEIVTVRAQEARGRLLTPDTQADMISKAKAEADRWSSACSTPLWEASGGKGKSPYWDTLLRTMNNAYEDMPPLTDYSVISTKSRLKLYGVRGGKPTNYNVFDVSDWVTIGGDNKAITLRSKPNGGLEVRVDRPRGTEAITGLVVERKIGDAEAIDWQRFEKLQNNRWLLPAQVTQDMYNSDDRYFIRFELTEGRTARHGRKHPSSSYPRSGWLDIEGLSNMYRWANAPEG